MEETVVVLLEQLLNLLNQVIQVLTDLEITVDQDSPGSGGGGGGAGASGGSSQPGGVGKAYTIGDGTTSVYYAGGGGGIQQILQLPVENQNIGGYGGQGGGGNGGKFTSDVKGQRKWNKPTQVVVAAVAQNQGESPVGTSGGKGIVIVRF